MYVPNLFHETDTETLLAFMKTHSFATVISSADGLTHAAHLPLTVHKRDDGIYLIGHFAKANPQWQMLEKSETLIIFAGPHAYISPRAYSKQESVPTWNYMAVHAYGQGRLLDPQDKQAVEQALAGLIAAHEPDYQQQWDGLSEKYKTGMKRGIVAFEICVTRLEGAMKLSQNKTTEEQHVISQNLLKSDDVNAIELGKAMQRCLDKLTNSTS